MGLDSLITIPSKSSLNSKLTSPSQQFMLDHFGKPGKLTRDCSDAFPAYQNHLETRSVGPFRVTGHVWAVDSLEAIFSEVLQHRQDLYKGVKTDGMFCCRAKRVNPNSFSNHSWGMAIDLYFGQDVTSQGQNKTQQGLLELYYYFHKHGWYWGAVYPEPDSMHFEMSVEKLSQLIGQAAQKNSAK